MPELLIELFSEEIPARLQRDGAEALVRLVAEALAPLNLREARPYWGPRRIALSAMLDAAVPGRTSSERGPRASAPEQALAGFLRKHGAERDALRAENGFWVLDRRHDPGRGVRPDPSGAARPAAPVPVVEIHALGVRPAASPGSVRYAGCSACSTAPRCRSAWRPGETDDGHGLVAGAHSEGHRFLSPGAFAVTGTQDWLHGLRARHVLAEAGERAALIRDGVARLAQEAGTVVVPDEGLVEEVAGLVEWPVPLLGHIDDAFMDLPPEVMQVSMRVNQRYFALRRPDGSAAPAFVFVANTVAADGGALTVAGNERVLRARFSDARHFWDLDRAVPLARRVAALDAVTFHAALGSQGERAARLIRLATMIAPQVGADPRASRPGRASRQGRPADRNGRRVSRVAGRDGGLLRAP